MVFLPDQDEQEEIASPDKSFFVWATISLSIACVWPFILIHPWSPLSTMVMDIFARQSPLLDILESVGLLRDLFPEMSALP